MAPNEVDLNQLSKAVFSFPKINIRTKNKIIQSITETHKKQVLQPLQKLRDELKETVKKEQKEDSMKNSDKRGLLMAETKKLIRNESMNIRSFLDFNFLELFKIK